MQGRVERALAGGQRISAPLANPSHDVVSVQLAVAEGRQDEQGQRPFQELRSDPPVFEHRNYLAFRGIGSAPLHRPSRAAWTELLAVHDLGTAVSYTHLTLPT